MIDINRIATEHMRSYKLIRKLDTFTEGNSKNKEYIPLYAVKFPITRTQDYPMLNDFLPIKKEATRILMPFGLNSVFHKLIRDSLTRLLHRKSNRTIVFEARHDEELTKFIAAKLLKASVLAVKRMLTFDVSYSLCAFNEATTINSVREYSMGAGSYHALIRNIHQGNHWVKHSLRSASYDINLGTCLHLDDVNKIKTSLFSLMIHSSYIPYIRLCKLYNEDPLNEVYEFWVNSEFDIPRSEYKSLRTQYRKKIKPLVEASMIPIIEKDDLFNELFDTIGLPSSIKSIREKRNWLTSIADEVKGHLQVTHKLAENKLILCA